MEPFLLSLWIWGFEWKGFHAEVFMVRCVTVFQGKSHLEHARACALKDKWVSQRLLKKFEKASLQQWEPWCKASCSP